MKVLHIVRHAEAPAKKSGQTDFDRALTQKGTKTARAVARRLRKAGFRADQMISSSAPRALQTARAFAKELKYSLKKVAAEQMLYDGADNESLLKLIRGLPVKVSDAFLFGHDPSFSHFAQHLIDTFNQPMPRCAVVSIGFEAGTWADASPANARLLRFDFPMTKRERERRINDEVQALAASLSSAMGKYLHGLDPRTAEKLRRTVFKHHSDKKMRKIARRFVEMNPRIVNSAKKNK